MNIQLLNPPVHHYAGVHYRMNPGLGLPILAAVLHARGHDVQVTDLEALAVSPGTFGDAFAKQRESWPDVVGFTVTTHNHRGAEECITALREVGYTGLVMVGGPHLLADADWPQRVQGVDCFVYGECEGNIGAIVEDGVCGHIKGQPMPIADIPAPLWSHHTPQPRRYEGNLPRIDYPEGISMWSRGCPHHCRYCGNPIFGHQPIRRRPAAAIRDEMAALQERGIKTVFVYDDELVGPRGAEHEAWLREVCAAIAPLGMTWKCQGRCSKRLTLDTLQSMHDAGCRAIMWGIESFSDRVLAAIRKDLTEDEIWHTLRLAKEAGIDSWGFFMVGNYQETVDDLAYTEQALRKARTEGLLKWRQVTVCTPVPGTELYEIAKREGWLVEPPETGPQMNQVYAATGTLNAAQIGFWKRRLEAA